MAVPSAPSFVQFTSSDRIEVTISDWRLELTPGLPVEEKERQIYGKAWEAYLAGDFGFGLWCWRECDRLLNGLNGNLRELGRVLGPGHYFGFSHRRAVALAVPLDRIDRTRKHDNLRPPPDAIVLAHYQLLCVYAARAKGGDPIAKAEYTIAVSDLENRRRADPYLRYFESFRNLLERPEAPPTGASTPASAATPGGATGSTVRRRSRKPP